MAVSNIDNSAPVGESSIMVDLWCVHAMLAGAESLLADADDGPAHDAGLIAHMAQRLIAKAIADIDRAEIDRRRCTA